MLKVELQSIQSEYSGNSYNEIVLEFNEIFVDDYYVDAYFDISFDANGGTGTAPQLESVRYGQAIILPTNTFIRPNYSLYSWLNGSTDYFEGDSFFVTDDVVFDANWELNESDETLFLYTLSPNNNYYLISKNPAKTLPSMIVLPKSHNGLPVKEIKGGSTVSEGGFANDSNIVTVYLLSSYTRIGTNAFNGCTLLCEVIISNSMTEVKDYAFANCTSLSSFSGGVNVASFGNYVFFNSVHLINIDLPDAATTLGNSCFENCFGLLNITLSRSIISLGNRTFYNCVNLLAISFPFKLTSIGSYAFSCESGYYMKIKTVYFEHGTMLEYIGEGAFKNCKDITNIELPDNVSILNDEVFYNCENLETIQLSSNLTSIGDYTFANCYDLHEIVFPMTLSYIGEFSFSNDRSLVTLEFPVLLNTISQGCFSHCSSLTKFTALGSIISIGDLAFEYCTNFEKTLAIPSSVRVIGNYTFYSCTSINRVNLNNAVSSIGSYAFAECDNLVGMNDFNSIKFPTSTTVLNSYCFTGCDSITTFKSTTIVSNGMNEGVFSNCKNLVNFNGTNINWSSVHTIIPKKFFQNCISIAIITIPVEVATISELAFENCKHVFSLSLKYSSNIIIKEGAFKFIGSGNVGTSPTNVYVSNNVFNVSFFDKFNSQSENYFKLFSTWYWRESTWYGSVTTSYLTYIGQGTQRYPYQISTADQLAGLASSVNAGNNYYGITFMLTSSLNLSSMTWQPIGNVSYPFCGNFASAGKDITNLLFQNYNANYIGLFGYISGSTYGAEISYYQTGMINNNVGMRTNSLSVSVTSGSTIYPYINDLLLSSRYIGVFAGCLENALVCEVDTYGKVFGYYAGGLAGRALNTTMVVSCVNRAVVIGSNGYGYYSQTDYDNKNVKSYNNLTLAGLTAYYGYFYDVQTDHLGLSGGSAGAVGGFVGYQTGYLLHMTTCTNYGNVYAGSGGDGAYGGTFSSTVSQYYATYKSGVGNRTIRHLTTTTGSYFNVTVSHGLTGGSGGNAGRAGGFVGYSQNLNINSSSVRSCSIVGGYGGTGKVGGSGSDGATGYGSNVDAADQLLGKNGGNGGDGGTGGSANYYFGIVGGYIGSYYGNTIYSPNVSITNLANGVAAGGNGGTGGRGGAGRPAFNWGFLNWGTCAVSSGRSGAGGIAGANGNGSIASNPGNRVVNGYYGNTSGGQTGLTAGGQSGPAEVAYYNTFAPVDRGGILV